MTDSSVSTRVASELLAVHESSIKRWCNAGELDYWTTQGGHRRIPISKLVTFGLERGFEGGILSFDDSAERVWVGLQSARKGNDYTLLSRLVLDWINLGQVQKLEDIVGFLTDQGMTLGEILDNIVASAMAQVGSAYVSTELSVGDEHRLTGYIRDALVGMRSLLLRRNGWSHDLPQQTAVVGCVRGEMHEIGALMIRLLLTKAGWNVVYLGQNVPTEEFHEQAVKYTAKLICISVAPPRGTAEAIDASRLITRLASPSSHIHLAVGGAGLDLDLTPGPNEVLEDIQFFNRASPFEEWITTLTN